MSPGGVDMRTGQYVYSSTDLEGGGDAGISFVRSSGDPDWRRWNVMGQFTHNWHIYATYNPLKNGNASFEVKGSRGQQFLAPNTNNFFTLSSSLKSSLQAITTGPATGDRYFVYTAADGAKITFRPPGIYNDRPTRLQSNPSVTGKGFYASRIEEPDGRTYVLSYDEPTSSSPAFLRRVTSNNGFVLILEWISTANGLFVSKACLFNAAVDVVPSTNSCATATYKTSYTYASNGYMSTATDALGNVYNYSSTYNQAAWDAAINSSPNTNYVWADSFYKPGESQPYLINSKYRTVFYEYVDTQNFLDGPDYSYIWDIVEHNETTMEVAGGTTARSDGGSVSINYQVMRRAGYTYGDSYLISQGPKLIKDETGRVTSADYCVPVVIGTNGPFLGGATGCAAVSARYWRYPEGNQSDYKYDGWGNVLEIRDKPKSGSIDAEIVRSFSYDCTSIVTCRKPSVITAANGGVTNVIRSAIHGGVLKMILPADNNGVRPETRYAYAQRYAWIKNGSGYIQASSPIWVLSSEEFCKTSAADSSGNCAAGASDEVITAYDYGPNSGPNNLWLRGVAVTADSQTLRTCYSYDKWGRKISETKPAANLAVCP